MRPSSIHVLYCFNVLMNLCRGIIRFVILLAIPEYGHLITHKIKLCVVCVVMLVYTWHWNMLLNVHVFDGGNTAFKSVT